MYFVQPTVLNALGVSTRTEISGDDLAGFPKWKSRTLILQYVSCHKKDYIGSEESHSLDLYDTYRNTGNVPRLCANRSEEGMDEARGYGSRETPTKAHSRRHSTPTPSAIQTSVKTKSRTSDEVVFGTVPTL